jgi:Protein of unknown function (DUF3237)
MMAESQTSVAVEYLGRVTFDIGPRVIIEEGPQGTRAIVPVVAGSFEGPKIQARLSPPAGDWITMRPDGSYKLDVRVTWVTTDGAAILMTYSGIGQLTDNGSTIRSAPLFEVGDPRYAWLNRIQAVGIGGRTGQDHVGYEIYALL